jgi:hypothetical protein
MSSKQPNLMMRSAAWRISLWASLAFAIGTMLVFAMLHRFVADDIQRRSDAWLSGEVGVLGDVAARTPKDRLYSRVVGEVAELASREDPVGTKTTLSSSFRQPTMAPPSFGLAPEMESQILLPSARFARSLTSRSMCVSGASEYHSESPPFAWRTAARSILGCLNATNCMC